FLALLHASKLRKPGKRQVQDKAQFDREAIQNHIRILHSDKHHEHTRWFNSFLGRIFLGVYKTKKIQEIFIAKIKRKTLKLKRPSFLGEIKVRSFNIGHSIPYITRTKLHDLATNGELSAEFHMDYRGGIRVEIEVDVGLKLMTAKPVKVTVVLAVLVKALSGMMTLKIKAPPTNRFWIGFQEPPEMDMVIEPIVADKAIKLNMVISAIKTKIEETMVEAIVLPNMDDYPFFDSRGTGGIFEGDEEVLPESMEESDAESIMMETTTTTGRTNSSSGSTITTSTTDSHHGPRIFASSSPSNGPSKRASTASLRRLASLESSPSADENDSDKDEDNNDDVEISPTKNDPLNQSLTRPTTMTSSSSKKTTPQQDQATTERRKPDFDTFPRSASGGQQRWDSIDSNGSSGSGSSKNDNVDTKLSKDDLSLEGRRGSILSSSSSSSHVGMAGILETENNVRSAAAGSSISQVQGNLAKLNKKIQAPRDESMDEVVEGTVISKPSSISSSKTASILRFKSQAVLENVKKWAKPSSEDRRLSDDDPLLAGKMRSE
ncbi:hypothetical protein BGZ65_005771, partial [Modicella reniformis]